MSEHKKLVKISAVVSDGTTRMRVAVRARSIERALSLAAGRHPGGERRVVFPTDPGGFFVQEDSAARMAMAGSSSSLEQPHGAVA